ALVHDGPKTADGERGGMAGGPKPQRGPLPLRVAMRLASRLIDPQGSPSDDKLRDAVAGKVILVTGASHGIGRATARKLGEAGATVLLVARSADRLQELAAEIAADGGSAHAHPADLSDPAAVDALAAEVLARHGRVDVLVSNAGK